MSLFHRTFEEGLHNTMNRPTMGEWVDALNNGLNELLMCESCRIHYPYSNAHHCPFCEKEPEYLLSIKIQRWEEEESYDSSSNSINKQFVLQPNVIDVITIDKRTTKYLKAFHLLSVFDNFETPIAQLTIKPAEEPNMARLIVTPLDDYVIFFKIPELNIEQSFDKEKKFKFNIKSHKEMLIGLKNFSTPQRVLVI